MLVEARAPVEKSILRCLILYDSAQITATEKAGYHSNACVTIIRMVMVLNWFIANKLCITNDRISCRPSHLGGIQISEHVSNTCNSHPLEAFVLTLIFM